MAQLSIEAAPERVRRGAGRYPQPVVLLARLGVDSRHEGRGLGAGLLSDVLLRFVAVADEIGTRAVLAHAESEAARSYYLHLIPDFLSSPADPLHLVLLAKDLRRSLRRAPADQPARHGVRRATSGRPQNRLRGAFSRLDVDRSHVVRRLYLGRGR
ncbi:MAG: hypothetical protein NVS3B26_21650 [Mycobacteriales bacterium]